MKVILLLLVAWLPATQAVVALSPGGGVSQDGPGASSGSDEQVRMPFTHAKHVPDAWLDTDQPERLRDCRGCHNYSASGPTDPQQACAKCHFGNTTNDYTFQLSAESDSFLHGLEALRTPGSLFQHSNHLALECRECHSVEDDSASAPILMPKAGGLSLCRECHAGKKPRQAELHFMSVWRDGMKIPLDYQEKAIAKLQRGLVDALNGSAEMGPNQGDDVFVEPFRHSDHILPASLGARRTLKELLGSDRSARGSREADCAACHGPMFEAAAGFATPEGEERFVVFEQSAQTCGSCHISDQAGTPIEFALAPGTHPSRTAGTFSHADHLALGSPGAGTGQATAQGRAAIDANGCRACHDYDATAAEGYVLRAALRSGETFRGCQECHAESSWAPADHGEWWTPEDHGDWRACSSCHEFGSADFGTHRLQVPVRRRRPRAFRIETQAHPHITAPEGESIDESCSKCHRQPVAELPSRIEEAAFRHSSHLPPDPTGEDCAGCHGSSVTGAEQSADIGARILTSNGLQALGEDDLGFTFDPAACSECHLGSVPVASAAEDPVGDLPARLVEEFSHAGHIGRTLAGGRPIGCVDCHSAGAKGAEGPGVGTLAAALDCTLCHDHSGVAGPERARLTGGGITAQEVAACSQCHTTGIPAMGGTVELPSARVVDLKGSVAQFHPNDQDCSTCHIPREGIIAAPVPSTHSRVFALRTFYRPEEGTKAKPAIHRGDTRKLIPERVICFACHWTDTLVDSSDAGTAIPDPERPSIRASQGDSLKGFPGGNPEHFEER